MSPDPFRPRTATPSGAVMSYDTEHRRPQSVLMTSVPSH
jgi:hypothetical protein